MAKYEEEKETPEQEAEHHSVGFLKKAAKKAKKKVSAKGHHGKRKHSRKTQKKRSVTKR